MKRLIVIAALLAAPGLAMAQNSTAPTTLDRFELWNECKPFSLLVEDLDSHAAGIGLTIERIETAVRSKLRAARIYGDSHFPYFYVRVVVSSFGVYLVQLSFNKRLADPISGEEGGTPTWRTGKIGTHGRDAGFIVQGVSEHTDKFIDEYLRVNAEACNAK